MTDFAFDTPPKDAAHLLPRGGAGQSYEDVRAQAEATSSTVENNETHSKRLTLRGAVGVVALGPLIWAASTPEMQNVLDRAHDLVSRAF